MRKCLRCEHEMVEGFAAYAFASIGGLVAVTKVTKKAVMKCAVCPECGYTEMYVEDTSKIKKYAQDKK